MTKGKKTGSTQAVERPKKLLKSGVSPDVGKATQFKPGVSGNPAGPKPGYKHISTHIQELLNDDDFSAWVSDPRYGAVEFKGRPMEAIIKAQAVRAMNGDAKAADWLAKYGYGTKVELSGPEGQPLGNPYAALNPDQLRALAEAQQNAAAPDNTRNTA